MFWVGVKEIISSPSNMLANLALDLSLALVIGYFWFYMTGDPNMMVYILITEAITTSRPRYISKQLNKMVQSGDVASFLVRPSSLFMLFLPYHLGRFCVRLIVNTAVLYPIAWWFGVVPNPVFFLLAFIAFVPSYAFYFIVGSSSFFIGDSSPIRFIIDKLVFLLGGTLIPLDRLPAAVRLLADVLPMKHWIYVPAKAGINQFAASELAASIIWIPVLVALAMLIEKKGVKRYEVSGG